MKRFLLLLCTVFVVFFTFNQTQAMAWINGSYGLPVGTRFAIVMENGYIARYVNNPYLGNLPVGEQVCALLPKSLPEGVYYHTDLEHIINANIPICNVVRPKMAVVVNPPNTPYLWRAPRIHHNGHKDRHNLDRSHRKEHRDLNRTPHKNSFNPLETVIDNLKDKRGQKGNHNFKAPRKGQQEQRSFNTNRRGQPDRGRYQH